MSDFYVEIIEEETELNDFRPLEILRKYVKDEVEAEKVYSEEISKFKNPKAKFVIMNHDKDSKLNKPCVAKDFKDGKVVSQ